MTTSHDNAYFLLYGQTFQNLRLFIERILHRLSQEVRPHLVLKLPYRHLTGEPGCGKTDLAWAVATSFDRDVSVQIASSGAENRKCSYK